jgi:energy-coupling factor transporter ATP-binding protein EcfA2
VRLNKFSYSEERGPGEEWEIEGLVFGQFNLVVGRNATGKTRLLKAIARAAASSSGEAKGFSYSAKFHTVMPDVRDDPEFPEAKNATDEKVARLRREASEKWGRRLQYFPFAGPMNLKVPEPEGSFSRLEVAEAYRRGEAKPGFRNQVSEWMEAVGYPVEEIIVRDGNDGHALGVKKAERAAIVPFPRLSQGEQRALTLLTFLSLLEGEKKAATVLIDDFGEGLDFEHAAKATEFLLQRAPETKLQFIIATNDRYVMNNVPLEHWTVLVEEGAQKEGTQTPGAKTRVFNYANSKQKFDDFKFTGLNNFDFFSMDFASSEA